MIVLSKWDYKMTYAKFDSEFKEQYARSKD